MRSAFRLRVILGYFVSKDQNYIENDDSGDPDFYRNHPAEPDPAAKRTRQTPRIAPAFMISTFLSLVLFMPSFGPHFSNISSPVPRQFHFGAFCGTAGGGGGTPGAPGSVSEPGSSFALLFALNFSGVNELADAANVNQLFALTGLRDVVRGLHPYERVHLHAKSFLDAKRHIAGKVSLAIEQAGQCRPGT